MIEDLKPYSEYKDSGLPWLGEVPAHWETRRGKSLFSESNLPVRDGDEIVTCFRDGQVTLRKNRRTSGFMTALYEAGYQGVRTGQLVIHAMDAFAGAIGISDSDGKCTPEYIVLDPLSNSAHPSYYSQLLRHAARQQFILVQCPAVRERAPRFRYPNFGSMWMPLPSAREQSAIARFLAWATNRLDRAIGAKRRIIALLQEHKQAIIHRAVTRGLDPSVPLKDSGIPWLGEIPEHWEVRRLKWILRLQRGYDLPAERRKEGKIPVFSSGGHIDNHDIAMADPPGIVLGRYGSTNAAYFIETPYWPHNTALFSTTVFGNNAKWCFYLLQALPKSVHSEKSAVPGVNRRDLFDILAPLAPLAEQAEIAAHVDAATVSLKEAIEIAERDVTLLREYRTRLIADVVTGKLDVREMAKELPEEELQDQPDIKAVYDADDSEEDAESDLIDPAEP
jgi:type I restriction enzyme S subunit